MATISKDITTFLEDNRIEHHPARIRSLLSKLDHEELEDLLDLLDILEIAFENDDGSI